MTLRQLAAFLLGVVAAAACAHLIWSGLIAGVLSIGYQNRVFDLRRWNGMPGLGTSREDTKELLSRFLDTRLTAPEGGPKIGFFGSSMTFGYPWQEPVVFVNRFAQLRRDAIVANASLLGAEFTWINDFALCSAYRQRVPLDIAVVEIPVINATSHLVRNFQDTSVHPAALRRISSCDDAPQVRGYFGFVVRRPLGVEWIRFAWDNEAYWKPDHAIVLQKVPRGYFATYEGFAVIEATYRDRIVHMLRNAISIGRVVYAFPSPVYIDGLEEIGEDAAALRYQFKVTLDACRSVAGVICLDPIDLLSDRRNFWNVTHLNQRGHRAMGEWLAREVAVK